MSKITERLVELRLYLDHLRRVRQKVPNEDALRTDLSLRNDVLFSLVTISQLVIDIAGELSARRHLRFEDYTEAVRNLAAFPEFSKDSLRELQNLPGFRNVVVHEYISLDYGRVMAALDRLDPVEEFLEAVRRIEEGEAG
jgi:uncharacterized protein YutE (UPF0331/DUF86 family)